MARPSNSVTTTSKHLTAAELAQRKAAEKAAMTGISIRERAEVKNNAAAHEEFERIIELLDAVGKNDAIIETVINRYCTLLAECADFEAKRERINNAAVNLEQKLDELGAELDYTETKDAAKTISKMYESVIKIDRQIQQKRRMLFDIEKENSFTLAAALRSIPKKVGKENPLAAALRDDD